MFDARLRPLIDPPLNRVGKSLASRGVSANLLTLIGLVVGLAAAVAIGFGAFGLSLGLIVLNRLLDGLDGAVARARGPTGLGGYLDILADFVFYVSIPLAFGLRDPADTVAALVLVGCFALTGISFLAFAAIAAQRGDRTQAHGPKSFFYSTGLAEGGETIIVFVAMTVWPGWFTPIAYAYGGLCIATVIQRSMLARSRFN